MSVYTRHNRQVTVDENSTLSVIILCVFAGILC